MIKNFQHYLNRLAAYLKPQAIKIITSKIGYWLVLGLFILAFIGVLVDRYYLHVAVGQMRVIWGKVPIAEALENPDYADYHQLLKAVAEIRAFGIAKVGLKDTPNYQHYYHTTKPGMTHVLTAAYPLALKSYRWDYPFVGKLPFRGFFDEHEYHRNFLRLINDEFDVWDFHSSAYSTLGWFRDPVTTPMLRRGVQGLAEVLIHEMVHETLFIEDQPDFNEQLASFVGAKAALEYVTLHNIPLPPPPTPDQIANREQLNNLLWGIKDELETIYQRDISDGEKYSLKKQLVENAALQIAEIYPQSSLRFRTVNNARLLQLRRYRPDSPELENIWQESKQDWPTFWQNIKKYKGLL